MVLATRDVAGMWNVVMYPIIAHSFVLGLFNSALARLSGDYEWYSTLHMF